MSFHAGHRAECRLFPTGTFPEAEPPSADGHMLPCAFFIHFSPEALLGWSQRNIKKWLIWHDQVIKDEILSHGCSATNFGWFSICFWEIWRPILYYSLSTISLTETQALTVAASDGPVSFRYMIERILFLTFMDSWLFVFLYLRVQFMWKWSDMWGIFCEIFESLCITQMQELWWGCINSLEGFDWSSIRNKSLIKEPFLFLVTLLVLIFSEPEHEAPPSSRVLTRRPCWPLSSVANAQTCICTCFNTWMNDEAADTPCSHTQPDRKGRLAFVGSRVSGDPDLVSVGWKPKWRLLDGENDLQLAVFGVGCAERSRIRPGPGFAWRVSVCSSTPWSLLACLAPSVFLSVTSPRGEAPLTCGAGWCARSPPWHFRRGLKSICPPVYVTLKQSLKS